MANSSTRQKLRIARQAANRSSLTPEQKKHTKAAEQYIKFSGKRGHGTGRPFEAFVEQHG